LIYEEFGPAPRHATEVDCYWRFRLEPHDRGTLRHVIPPDGAISLCVVKAPIGIGVSILGPAYRAHVAEVRQGFVYAGARLRPGGGLQIPCAAPLDIAGQTLGEGGVDPALAAWLRHTLSGLFDDRPERAGDAAFDAWPFGRAADDPLVRRVVDELAEGNGGERIARLARAVDLSERQLRRRFSRAVGLSPKTFARVRRLRRACFLAVEAGSRMGSVSSEAGYADQAHLSREVLESFGAPPAAVAAYLRLIRHAAVREGACPKCSRLGTSKGHDDPRRSIEDIPC